MLLRLAAGRHSARTLAHTLETPMTMYLLCTLILITHTHTQTHTQTRARTHTCARARTHTTHTHTHTHTHRGNRKQFTAEGQPGKVALEMYKSLTDIQTELAPDNNGWVVGL